MFIRGEERKGRNYIRGKGSFHKAASETEKDVLNRNLLQAFLPASSLLPPPRPFSPLLLRNKIASFQAGCYIHGMVNFRLPRKYLG